MLPKRAELFLSVAVPIAAMWLLCAFAPADLSGVQRLTIAALFTFVWGPLMYLRVRN